MILSTTKIQLSPNFKLRQLQDNTKQLSSLLALLPTFLKQANPECGPRPSSHPLAPAAANWVIYRPPVTGTGNARTYFYCRLKIARSHITYIRTTAAIYRVAASTSSHFANCGKLCEFLCEFQLGFQIRDTLVEFVKRISVFHVFITICLVM